MRNYKIVLLLVLLFLPCHVIKAQEQDSLSVSKVIHGLFDAMREADSSKVHQLFRPDARMFTSYTSKSGENVVKEGRLNDFLKAVGTPHPEIYDERIQHTVIQIDGGIAQVWTEYQFFVGDNFSHCGVDAFHLVKDPDGSWRILQLMDTRRKNDCSPLP